MTRVLCACETNLPGSAAEKPTQRADLESMLNQLEEEGLQKATTEMPQHHANNSAGSTASYFFNHTNARLHSVVICINPPILPTTKLDFERRRMGGLGGRSGAPEAK